MLASERFVVLGTALVVIASFGCFYPEPRLDAPPPSARFGVASGALHTCAYGHGEEIFCWGYGEAGRLGLANEESVGDDETPAEAGSVDVGEGGIIGVATGWSHSCVLLEVGAVRCWGQGALGQLGQGATSDIGARETPGVMPRVPIAGVVETIAAGGFQTCALMESGGVRCWGDTVSALAYGRVDEIPIGAEITPADAGDLPLAGPARLLAVGALHACVVVGDAMVHCWGLGSMSCALAPETNASACDDVGAADAIATELGEPVSMIAAGDEHTCVLLESGTVRCWGSDTFGQLGRGPTGRAEVSLGQRADVLRAGGHHTCAVLEDRSLTCWGHGTSWELLYGDEVAENVGDDETPEDAGVLAVGEPVVDVAPGGEHICALTSEAHVRCWGNGYSGQLGYGWTGIVGDDETPDQLGPVPLW